MNYKGKKVYLEVMRIIACALVIFNHLPGYLLYFVSDGYKQFFYMTLAMITRINVPLFFMISGSLLFKKEEQWTHVFQKRFLRIVYLLLFADFLWIVTYKVNSLIYGTDFQITFLKCIQVFLLNKIDTTSAYWYLYSYLGVLFVLPFLQRMAKEVTKFEVLALLVLHAFSSSFFPIINIFLNKNSLPSFSFYSSFSVPFAFDKAFFYTLIGYYIDNKIDMGKIKKKHLVELLFCALVGILLSNWGTYCDATLNGAYSQHYVQLFDYITSIVAFILIKYLFVVAFPGLSKKIISERICFVGSLTLGIYILDPCLKNLFYNKYEKIAEPLLPTLFVSFGWVLFSMLFGGITTFFLKKAPLVKRIV